MKTNNENIEAVMEEIMWGELPRTADTRAWIKASESRLINYRRELVFLTDEIKEDQRLLPAFKRLRQKIKEIKEKIEDFYYLLERRN